MLSFLLNIRDFIRKISPEKKFVIYSVVVIACLYGISSYVSNKLDDMSDYPFAKYTSDNVGEIKAVSGVGEEISIFLAGDIMCHDGQIEDALKDDGYDFTGMFEDVSDVVQSADIAVANLESLIVDENLGYSGYPSFFSPVEWSNAISSAGFNAVSIGNEQCDNGGSEALSGTVDYLSKDGIEAFGTKDMPYTIITKNGISVAFISIIDDDYYDTLEDKGSISDYAYIYDRGEVRDLVQRCQSAGADLIIAYVRWGEEAESLPTDDMRDKAEFMISLGVDVIVGGGSHSVMPMEIIDTDSAYSVGSVERGYVYYSLGNFISNQRSGSQDIGAAVMLKVRKFSDTSTRVNDYEIIPVYTNVDIADGHNFKTVPALENSTPPAWMDEYNSERFNKVYNIVSTILSVRLTD